LPYPFAQCPTLAEFKRILEQDFDARFLEGPEFNSNDGPCRITYFERTVDGEVIQYSVYFEDGNNDDLRIDLHLVRSICTRLKINPARFGLNLG
jgi:hypothetical protein